jgi:hypothetical protein
MSNHQSSYTSYSSSTSYTTSSSSSSNSNPAQPQTKSYTETANYDSRTGGNITRESRETGQPTLTERKEIPVQGQVQQGGDGSGGGAGRGRIEDVTDRDQEYLERMEDEYAKREVGA